MFINHRLYSANIIIKIYRHFLCHTVPYPAVFSNLSIILLYSGIGYYEIFMERGRTSTPTTGSGA